jgi:hypothetical protein
MSVHKEKRGTNLPNQKNEKKKKKSLTSLPNKSLTTTKGYCFFCFFFPSFSFWLYPKHKNTHQKKSPHHHPQWAAFCFGLLDFISSLIQVLGISWFFFALLGSFEGGGVGAKKSSSN